MPEIEVLVKINNRNKVNPVFRVAENIGKLAPIDIIYCLKSLSCLKFAARLALKIGSFASPCLQCLQREYADKIRFAILCFYFDYH